MDGRIFATQSELVPTLLTVNTWRQTHAFTLALEATVRQAPSLLRKAAQTKSAYDAKVILSGAETDDTKVFAPNACPAMAVPFCTRYSVR